MGCYHYRLLFMSRYISGKNYWRNGGSNQVHTLNLWRCELRQDEMIFWPCGIFWEFFCCHSNYNTIMILIGTSLNETLMKILCSTSGTNSLVQWFVKRCVWKKKKFKRSCCAVHNLLLHKWSWEKGNFVHGSLPAKIDLELTFQAI